MRKFKKALPHVWAAAVLSAMVAVAGLTAGPEGGPSGPLPGPPPVKSPADAKDGDRVLVDGKVYTKEGAKTFRLDAKNMQLTHDGVTPHGTGRGFMPGILWPPNGDPYQDNTTWWVEGEVYVLHRQELSGNPPAQFDYYRSGFRLYSWRGDYDTIFGDEETPTPNYWAIHLGLVQHPLGGTYTTNLTRPGKVNPSNVPGNYTCSEIGPEVYVPYNEQNIVRANLWVRPKFYYWSTRYGSWMPIPGYMYQRILTSRGLIADGSDQQVPEQYSSSWSGDVPSPNLAYNYSNCAPEIIQN